MLHRVRSLLPMLVLAALPVALPSAASAGVLISVNLAPPVLPVYTQPVAPAPGYLWTPGYWAWGNGSYYWVPGAWVLPPQPGLLWTPGYWGWSGGVYVWHAGYWGPHVGFYGGVNYGYGYNGVGFVGGEWRGGVFFYNRAVLHVGFTDHVFVRAVPPPRFVTRVSFNGGVGGIVARPTRVELMAAREHHIAFTAVQRQHEQAAIHNQAFRNAGRGVEGREGAAHREGAARAQEHRPGAAAHAERRGGGRPAGRQGGRGGKDRERH